jgi:DNA-binding CsgD family transcriptional regulator
MVLAPDSIARLAEAIGECSSRREFEAVRLAWLDRAVGVDATYFGAASPNHSVSPVISGVDAERVERCEAQSDRYWRDRLVLQGAALAQGGAVADHDALSIRARERMPFYREVVAGHGIRATLIAVLRLRGRVWGSMYLGRTSRSARFQGDLAALRRALPILALGAAVHGGSEAPAPPLSSDGVRRTPREQVVLRLVCRGWTNAQIALHLGSSPRTVKNQVSAILKKTGAANRTQLTAERLRLFGSV